MYQETMMNSGCMECKCITLEIRTLFSTAQSSKAVYMWRVMVPVLVPSLGRQKQKNDLLSAKHFGMSLFPQYIEIGWMVLAVLVRAHFHVINADWHIPQSTSWGIVNFCMRSSVAFLKAQVAPPPGMAQFQTERRTVVSFVDPSAVPTSAQ